MHEYVLVNHDRKVVYYLIAFFASVVGIGLSLLLGKIHSLLGILIAPPSGILLFKGTFLVFDKWIWKLPFLFSLGLIRIPNMNGTWDGSVVSVPGEPDSPAIPQTPTIVSEVTIHQSYSEIRIRLETKKSNSLSTMASLVMEDPTLFKLRYEYLAEFRPDGGDPQRHFGVTEIVLKAASEGVENECKAKYYSESKRNTHGSINLKKRIQK